MNTNRKYCIFDYDDTIMQTRECKSEALIALGSRHFKKDVSIDKISELWGISHDDLFKQLFSVEGDSLKEAMALYADMDDEFPLVPHPDAKEALERLQKSHSLFIVSSCEKSLITTQLTKSSLSRIQFSEIYGCGETKFHKPSGKVFDVVFSQYPDMHESEVVYIGDGVKDFLAAADRGIEFLGVDRAKRETQSIVDAGGRVVRSLTDIYNELQL